MGTLEKFFEVLRDKGFVDANLEKLPNYAVVYARVLIREAGLCVPTDAEIEIILREEGMLPASTFGIPLWYRTKYGLE